MRKQKRKIAKLGGLFKGVRITSKDIKKARKELEAMILRKFKEAKK